MAILTRRLLLAVALVSCLASCLTSCSPPWAAPAPTAAAVGCSQATTASNPVAAENTCAGSDAWRIDHPLGSEDAIEGFVAPASAVAGDVIHLYISTLAPTYSFQVFRMGYYQGHGARLIYSSGALAGIGQPAPVSDPQTRMVSAAQWRSPESFRIPATWVSGVYLLKLLSSTGYIRYTLFVVRDDASTAPLAIQIPLLTYQAYNRWGGASLYRGHSVSTGELDAAERSYAVSFDRPYDSNAGLGDFPLYDFELLNWLERKSYNVTYLTDIDLDEQGALAQKHKVIAVSGHSEYWSSGMRSALTSARDAGVSLAFFGGNDIYWHVRLDASLLGTDRIVTCYKDAALDPLTHSTPLAATVRWEDPPLDDSEVPLVGQMYGGGVASSPGLTLAGGSQPLLDGSSASVGMTFSGLIGGEYDRLAPLGEPAGVTIVAASPLVCVRTTLCPKNDMDVADATLYRAPGGAMVFDAGTFQWSWGLSNERIVQTAAMGVADPRFQQVTANLLASLLAS